MSTAHRLPVVVGVDGVRGRLGTVDVAAAEAQLREAPLTVVHVWPGRYGGSFRSLRAVPSEADGHHLLDLAVQRIRRDHADLEVRTQLIDGAAAVVLAQCSTDAQLIVVGHRDDSLARHGWGSTATYLAHHAACPLLVDRGAGPHKGPVVLAASAREFVTATVAAAFEEAVLHRAPLVAVHVWSGAPGDAGGSALPPTSSRYAAAREEADRMLAEALAGWSTQYPDVEVRRLVVHDPDVAYTLERASQRGRLFVAGRGRRGRLAELLYGSVNQPMLRKSVCPVLLVPPARPTGMERPGLAAADRPDRGQVRG